MKHWDETPRDRPPAMADVLRESGADSAAELSPPRVLSSPAHVLALQRSAGNALVASYLARQATADAEITMDPLMRINDEPVIGLEDFRARCQEAHGYVDTQYDHAAATVKRHAIKYAEGWTSHTATLERAKVAERLVGDQITQALLAFVPGGIGGSVGAVMKKANAGEFLSDGVKDLVKSTLRRSGADLLAGDAPTYKPVGRDPLTWQNGVEAALLDEKAFVQGIVNFWLSRANLRATSFPLNFDPVAEVEKAVQVAGSPWTELPVATERDAWTFEKSLWNGWIERHRYYLQELSSRAGVGYQVGDRMPEQMDAIGGLPARSAGKHIRGRLHALARLLGENAEEWMIRWGADSRRALLAERDRLNVDAPGSDLKRFLEWLLD